MESDKVESTFMLVLGSIVGLLLLFTYFTNQTQIVRWPPQPIIAPNRMAVIPIVGILLSIVSIEFWMIATYHRWKNNIIMKRILWLANIWSDNKRIEE